MIFAVLVVFCSRFMADQKSSRVATNLAYGSAERVPPQLLRFLPTSAGKFRRRMMRLEAPGPVRATLQRLAKAAGRWQFKRPTMN